MSGETKLEKRVGDDGCSIQHLANLARSSKSSSVLDDRWYELGQKLGIDLADLKKLKREDSVDKYSEILVLFRSQKSHEATLVSLCNGLRGCRLNEIAGLVEQNFLSDTLPDARTSCHVDLDTKEPAVDGSENNALLQRPAQTSLSTMQSLKKDGLKIRWIENNWCYLLLIMTIAVFVVTSILLLFVVEKYLVKNDGSSNKIITSQTSCALINNTLTEDCIIVSASSHIEYSTKLQNTPNEKCVYLHVNKYSSNDWPPNLKLPNAACIHGISFNSLVSLSGSGYFISNAYMVSKLSLDCHNGKLENSQIHFSNLTNNIIILKSLSVSNCDFYDIIEHLKSFANLAELNILEIKNVSLTSKNVLEINRVLMLSKLLQHVSVHALNFEANEAEIKLSTRLDSLKSLVLNIASPHEYHNIRPIHLINLCEMASNVSILKLTLGYFTLGDLYNLNECEELTFLEVNVILESDEMDQLAIDFYHKKLEKIELNLHFYNCPNYHRFQELCSELSHQWALKSCIISSNCPVYENGIVFSFFC